MTQTFFAPALDLLIQIVKSYDLDPDPLTREFLPSILAPGYQSGY